MSTILNALRRLEQDRSNHATGEGRSAETLSATDPHVADELRDRILAEEAAAQAGAAAHSESKRTKRRAMFAAAAALLVLGLGVGAYTQYRTSVRVPDSPTPTVVPEVASFDSAPEPEDPRTAEVVSLQPTIAPARVSQTPGAVAGSNAALAQRHIRPETRTGNQASEIPPKQTPPESEARSQPSTASFAVTAPMPADGDQVFPRPSIVSAAAATPTPAPVLEAATKPVEGSAPTASKGVDEMPLAAVTPTLAAVGRSRGAVVLPEAFPAETLDPRLPETSPPRSRPPPAGVAPNPPPRVSAPEPRQVERLDRRGLPDLTVLRTAWHPHADRRSVRIRLEATNEILSLREGDAIGGLVVQKISPSAVLFKAGEVEIRLRVGQPGSGG